MGLYPQAKFLLMGDRGFLLEFGDEISAEVNEKVRKMALAIQAETLEGIIEVVPTFLIEILIEKEINGHG